jgi:hypothetical protein
MADNKSDSKRAVSKIMDEKGLRNNNDKYSQRFSRIDLFNRIIHQINMPQMKIVEMRNRLGLLRRSDARVVKLVLFPLYKLWRGLVWVMILMYKFRYFIYSHSFNSISFNLTRIDEDRFSWEQAFISLWEPLYINNLFSKGKAHIRIKGPQLGSPGIKGSQYEAFARSFIGVSFYLHNKSDGLVRLSDGREFDIADLYREAIINGTSPMHKEYWGKISSSIRLVENCSLAIGLLLTRNLIWDKLQHEEKENIKRWFELQSKEHFPMNNWQWFKVFHHLFLEEVCSVDQSEAILEALRNILKMYNGRGWYSDGMPPNIVYDYYSCWAMQYYALMFSYFAGDRYTEWKSLFMDYAKPFFKDYKNFFSPNAQPPLYGRSQIYRWATLAPWGLALKLNLVTDDLQEIKELLLGTINTFFSKEIIKKDGILSCGYFKEFRPMMEGYSSPGSPYWAFKGFSLLLLPADHPFWKPHRKVCSFPRTINTMQSINSHISNDGRKHIIFFPNVITKPYINNLKYNKFAYSNLFLPDYDYCFPVDNYFILQGERGKYYQRDTSEIISCVEGICKTRWRIFDKPDIQVITTLFANIDGYIIKHEYYGTEMVRFYTGGFPLAVNHTDVHSTCTNDEIRLVSRGREVGVRLLSGCAKPEVLMRRNLNPAGKYSYVPYFKGFIKTGECISIEIWAKILKSFDS